MLVLWAHLKCAEKTWLLLLDYIMVSAEARQTEFTENSHRPHGIIKNFQISESLPKPHPLTLES